MTCSRIPVPRSLESWYLKRHWEVEHSAGQPIQWLSVCVSVTELDPSDLDPSDLDPSEIAPEQAHG